MNGIFLFVAAFLASAIESVEMVAILVGVGATRSWRSAWMGAAAGFALLAAVVIGMGAALQSIPIQWLRLTVGALLLIFGLQWLKKAVLRLARPNQRKKHVEEDEMHPVPEPGAMDWYAFVIAFKGVLLEGLEIAFVVVTFGAAAHGIGLASIAALAAFASIAGIAFWIRGWLARIHREWMRFAVGILLTSFGTFWSAEGSGAHWPGNDLSLVVLLAAVTAVSFTLLWLVRQQAAATANLQTT